jgi:hypothetical protein
MIKIPILSEKSALYLGCEVIPKSTYSLHSWPVLLATMKHIWHRNAQLLMPLSHYWQLEICQFWSMRNDISDYFKYGIKSNGVRSVCVERLCKWGAIRLQVICQHILTPGNMVAENHITFQICLLMYGIM